MTVSSTAVVIRRTVSTTSELTSGALMLSLGQWGLATVDDTLVCRDLAGTFHSFIGATAIAAQIQSSLYVRSPVATSANLPSGDPDATLRYVIDQSVYYLRANSAWNKMVPTTLANVNVTAPASGDSLVYEGGNWINRNFGAITKEITGFKTPESVGITYDSTTRKITLSGSVEAYYRSNLVPELVPGYVSPAHTAGVTTTQYLSYNGTSVSWSSTPWTFDTIQIAAVVYDTTGTYIATLRESHGTMQWQTHNEFHNTVGCYLTSGGDLSSYVLASTTAADRRPNISSTVISDEDLQTTNSALTTKLYTQFSMSGASTMAFTTGAADMVALNGTLPYWNQFTGGNWVQTPFGNNDYGAIFVFAMPSALDATSQAKRFVFVQPQSVSSTLATIQALTTNSVNLNGLASLNPELVYIAKIIIRASVSNFTLISVEKLVGTKVSQTAVVGNFLSTVATDATLTGLGTVASPLGVSSAYGGLYLPLAGGTLTGDLTISKVATPALTIGANTSTSTRLYLNGAAEQSRDLVFNTAGVSRWRLRCNTVAEGGANTGSNLDLYANDDAGATINIPISITRAATGNISLNRNTAITGVLYSNSSNGGIFGYTNDTADNFTTTLSSTTGQSSTRGGYIVVKGNEVATTGGDVLIEAGNSGTGTGDIKLYSGNAERLRITKSGVSTFTTPLLANDFTATGGNLVLATVNKGLVTTFTNVTDLNTRVGTNNGLTPFVSGITPANSPVGANWWTGAEYGYSTGLGSNYSWKMFAGSTLDGNFYVQKHINSVFGTQYELAIRNANNTFTGVITNSTLTASELIATNASKQLVSLPVATYPSLTELSYVKGVTSSIQTQLGTYLPLAGGTLTGGLSIVETPEASVTSQLAIGGNTTPYSYTILNGAAGAERYVHFKTAGTMRWRSGVGAGTESGSDAGAPYTIAAYTDAGGYIDAPLTITRAITGNFTTTRNILINKTTTPTITIGTNTATNARLAIDGITGTQRSIYFKTGGVDRWAIATDIVAESGSDVGARFAIQSYTDAGANIDTPLIIERPATGGIYLRRNTFVTGMVYSNTANGGIFGNTIDAGDNYTTTMSSTTGQSSTRGGYIVVKGNEVATTGGDVLIEAGNSGTGTGDIKLYSGNAERLRINKAGVIQALGNIELAGGYNIISNTADGADSNQIFVAGGGSTASSRGGRIVVNGNERATTGGTVSIDGGDSTVQGDVVVTTNATERLRITKAGDTYLKSPTVFLPSSGKICCDTVDGSDNSQIMLCGGGAATTSRGARVQLYGNEVATFGGDLFLDAGDATSVQGDIFVTTSNVTRLRITKAGAINLYPASAQAVNAYVASDTDISWNTLVTGDVYGRTTIYPGKIEFGAGGATPRDTNLYRSAANELKTDDAFIVGGALYPKANLYMAPATRIMVDTTDASDTSYLELNGGGGSGNGRGASIALYGNDNVTYGGNLYLNAGNNIQGDIIISTGATSLVERIRVTKAGLTTVASLTASRVLVTGTSKELVSSATTATEIGYVSGVTSSIQTQLNSKGVGTVTSVSALTLGTTGTDVTSTVATGTTTPVITLNIPTASAANRGALSSADWSTFNGKAPTDSPTFTGIVTAPIIYSATGIAFRTTSYKELLFTSTALTSTVSIIAGASKIKVDDRYATFGSVDYVDTSHRGFLQSSSGADAGFSYVIGTNAIVRGDTLIRFQTSNTTGDDRMTISPTEVTATVPVVGPSFRNNLADIDMGTLTAQTWTNLLPGVTYLCTLATGGSLVLGTINLTAGDSCWLNIRSTCSSPATTLTWTNSFGVQIVYTVPYLSSKSLHIRRTSTGLDVIGI